MSHDDGVGDAAPLPDWLALTYFVLGVLLVAGSALFCALLLTDRSPAPAPGAASESERLRALEERARCTDCLLCLTAFSVLTR